MPLANTPYLPQPDVELLGSSPISAQEASRRLDDFLRGEENNGCFDLLTGPQQASGAMALDHLRKVSSSLRKDWAGRVHAEQPSPCFVEVRARLEVHLHPFFLGPKLERGLRKAAGVLLLRWIPVLNCMPLTCAGLKPVGQLGALVGESPWVHFLAEFSSVGFAPKAGQSLVARIPRGLKTNGRPHEQGGNGISVQVLKHLSCFAPSNSVSADFWYNQERRGWSGPGDTPLTHRKTLWFDVKKVTEVNMTNAMSLKGSLRWDDAAQPDAGSASSSGSEGGAAVPAVPVVASHSTPPVESSNAPRGDWSCPKCKDVQFKRNSTCRVCGTARPEQARGAAAAAAASHSAQASSAAAAAPAPGKRDGGVALEVAVTKRELRRNAKEKEAQQQKTATAPQDYGVLEDAAAAASASSREIQPATGKKKKQKRNAVGGDGKVVTCKYCGSEFHMGNDCPERPSATQKKEEKKEDTPPAVVGSSPKRKKVASPGVDATEDGIDLDSVPPKKKKRKSDVSQQEA